MRVVSYNILDGGVGRADPIAEVLLARGADVVGLIEADDDAVVRRVAGRLNVDSLTAVGRSDDGKPPHAVALMTRRPILSSVNHAALRDVGPRCLLEAVVRRTDGSELTLGLVHLRAGASEADETARLQDVAVLLDTFATARAAGRPHVIMGDFNSNSPVARTDPDRLKPRSRREWAGNGNRLPRDVVSAMLDAGYVDTLHALRPGVAATVGTFSTRYPGQRVDYVFAYGMPTPTDAWVERDRLATFASDHYPVGAAWVT